jgi:serine/threonine protein kinase
VADTKQNRYTTVDRRRAVKLGRALASPTGVLVTLPVLVAAVGLGIMLVGRDATSSATKSMARHQLAEQAKSVQADTAFALDQADPLLKLIRPLSDRNLPTEDVLLRLHDVISGRPGVAWVSVSFPDGAFRGAELKPDGHIEVSESLVEPNAARWFLIDGGQLRPLRTAPHTYDPRKRDFYQLAAKLRMRVWTEPYTFFTTHATGITCAEPVFDDSDALRAVLTVDFDVSALSSFVARPAIDKARSVVFTGDGTVLAYPSGNKLAASGDRLIKIEDVRDRALTALYHAHRKSDELRYVQLDVSDGEYLASVAPIGGKRAGVPAPLDWYVATLVPERTLLGPTRTMLRSSIIASAGAISLAVGLALVLAWNLVRMRRQVQISREEARSAEARARELGSYRLVAKLGTGGMGEVWRAEHRLLARQAAIKLIRPEVMHDPDGVDEVRERFRREAQTLASMKSRHTIAIFDYGVTAEGIFYYVMELLDGLDLESLVVRYGAQPSARVIDILAQACQSLAEAHDAGLYHRDIKPPNLFLSRAADEVDICKLLDFGIVQTVQETPSKPPPAPDKPIDDTSKLTQIGAMLGTPGFMGPEQILGMQLDGRADLYSLGCCAWWLLTGSEVFPRDGGEGKVLHRHINEEVPSLANHVRGWLPPELEDVIRSLLAKDVDDRPANARELAAQLRAIKIPEEHVWTQARAAAWWRAYSPPAPAQPLPSGEVQVIMPGRTKAHRPLAATDERAIAATMAGPAQAMAGPAQTTMRERESFPRVTSSDDNDYD